MTSKQLFRFGGAAVLSAAIGLGALWAQGTGERGEFGGGRFRHGFRMGRFMANRLDLTEAQKAQAKTIFEDARKQNEPLAAQLKQIHQDARAAVKAGKSEAELRQIAASASPLVAQVAGNHLVAMSKFNQILTDAQREKLDQMRSHAKSAIERRRSHQSQQQQ